MGLFLLLAFATIRVSDDASLNLGFLLQPTAQLTFDGTAQAPSGNYATDFYLRRVRLYANGTMTKWAGFSFVTEQTRYGRKGDFTGQFFIQDGYVWLEMAPRQFLDVGFMLLPFSRNVLTGSTGYHTLDNHGTVINFFGADKGNREIGLQYRGHALDDALQWRIGVFNGLEGTASLNRNDRPAFFGRVHYSVLGTEPGFTYLGIAFAEKPIVTIGASAMYQNKSSLVAQTFFDLKAFSADAHAELPFDGDREIVVDGAVYRYEAGTGSPNTGTAYFAEAGFRWGIVEPIASWEYLDSDDPARSFRAIRGGLNFWVRRHQLNAKFEMAGVRTGKVGALPPDKVFTAQVQLFY